MRLFLYFMVVLALPFCAMATEVQTVKIAFVSQKVERPPVLSNLIEEPDNQGREGARLALKDNNTTGRFLQQKFTLESVLLNEDADVLPTLKRLLSSGHHLFVLDLPLPTLQTVLKHVKQPDVLFFNSRASDIILRQQACDFRLLHTMPSRAMLSDALAQYLVKKRWKNWFLIQGPHDGDQKFATSLKRSAQKYGATIIDEKIWNGGRDAYRSAQAEIPLLTQVTDYDILMVADEFGDFGEYLLYRTFDPRPVAGTQGLFPTAWHWTQEQWGALQLQNRFKKMANRTMTARDYASWAAVRTIGEAATRTKSNDFNTLNNYIRSNKFELAGFKGRKLSYRSWNGQLRQPIALSAARSLVTQAPIDGFLHRYTELDTLGFDRPESKCKEFIK